MIIKLSLNFAFEKVIDLRYQYTNQTFKLVPSHKTCIQCQWQTSRTWKSGERQNRAIFICKAQANNKLNNYCGRGLCFAAITISYCSIRLGSSSRSASLLIFSLVSSSMASSIDIQTTKTNVEVVEPNSTSLLSAIKAKYCTPPKEYYDPDVLHSQREIKVIAGSRRPGHYHNYYT